MTALPTPALETLPPTFRTAVAGPDGAPIEVRKFADGALQASIDRITAEIDRREPGHGLAILDVAAGSQDRTVTAVAAYKSAGGNWTILTGFAATFEGEWSGRVEIRRSF